MANGNGSNPLTTFLGENHSSDGRPRQDSGSSTSKHGLPIRSINSRTSGSSPVMPCDTTVIVSRRTSPDRPSGLSASTSSLLIAAIKQRISIGEAP